MRVILSGGGTGGHITPALAIAEELHRRNIDVEILYVGKKGGLEEQLVQEEGVPFRGIDVAGLPRKAINRQTVMSGLALMKGLAQCRGIIKKFRPDVVVGTGGYVCAPILLSAQRAKIPTLIQEQNAYPGKTNRFLGKRADAIALNFEQARGYFPENARILLTGNPIGRRFLENPWIHEGHEGRRVLSFGGSGGQESTNDAVLEMLKSPLDFHLTHITGKPHYEAFMEALGEVPENVEILPYSLDIPRIMGQSDLVIASSSAMTLAEISALKRPSILIPKAYTAGDHQTRNAYAVKEKGAAVVIEEKDLTSEVLRAEITRILDNPLLAEEMGAIAGSLGNPHAVEEIVDVLFELAGVSHE